MKDRSRNEGSRNVHHVPDGFEPEILRSVVKRATSVNYLTLTSAMISAAYCGKSLWIKSRISERVIPCLNICCQLLFQVVIFLALTVSEIRHL